jgi:hypothetical protein
MKLQIDNLDGAGLRDYTAAIDAARTPRITRKLNEGAELRFSLLQDDPSFVVPTRGARVLLGRTNGQDVFTGYITDAPEYEYLGWGIRGPMYRYNIVAQSDDVLLDEKRLPARSPFVDRSAGDALRQVTTEAMPGAFDLSAVQNLDTLPSYTADPQLPWSKHAAAIAVRARAAFRCMNGALIFAPLGAATYALNESDTNFSPQNLTLQPVNSVVNDATVIGEVEPAAYVRDYFVGDGLTARYHLSQNPYVKFTTTVFDEEYATAALDPTRWSVIDPTSAVSVSGGKLQVAGGNGTDGATTVIFVEKMEMGGATVLQHGDVVFNAASTGILGGLYLGVVSQANCVAGFQISPSGSASQIQALLNGAAAGSAMTTVAGHHYVLTTRIYSQEIFRQQQTFHSAAYPAGSGLGGAQVNANVRLVLEVHDIDPANPATMVAASTVLYDGVVNGAPAFCTYALVNSSSLQCAIAFTRFIQPPDAEVRSALPSQNYRTRLVGPLSSGGECNVYSGPTLDFFSLYVPALNELVEVHYRGHGRAMARVTNPTSIAQQQHGIDDGVRSLVHHVKAPPARTSADCENAALAVVTDGATAGWIGKYQTWGDFLPGGAADIFPGDALNVNVPSRTAAFQAVVTQVQVSCEDLYGDHSLYEIEFAAANTEKLAFEFDSAVLNNILTAAALNQLTPITNAQVGATVLPDLTAAAVTLVSSTTASLDAGTAPPAGGGIEVRWSDFGWGAANDQNLAGRFTTQTFTLPRLAKVQDYFLRQFDGSTPPRYSRHTAALHIDYPY